MGEARAEATINRRADEVWAVLGDFGNLSWMKGLDSGTVDGDVRTLSVGGREVVERQLSRDDTARTLTYGIVGTEHEATITVQPDGEASRVTWAVTAPQERLEGLAKTYEGALLLLKQELEG